MLSAKHVVEAYAKFLTVPILVVVANIQTRHLKAALGRVPCEQQLDMG